jgi:hypothetical protein
MAYQSAVQQHQIKWKANEHLPVGVDQKAPDCAAKRNEVHPVDLSMRKQHAMSIVYRASCIHMFMQK